MSGCGSDAVSNALLFQCIRLHSSFRSANRGMQGTFSVKVKEKEIQITFFSLITLKLTVLSDITIPPDTA